MKRYLSYFTFLKKIASLAFCIALLSLVPFAYGAANLQNNPPECDKSSEDCGCENGAEVAAACIKVNLDLGETTPWTGSMQCALKIFADSDSPNVFRSFRFMQFWEAILSSVLGLIIFRTDLLLPKWFLPIPTVSLCILFSKTASPSPDQTPAFISKWMSA